MNVGVYEAKSKLSDLLEKVRAGKEVVITRHGEPVAKLVSVAPTAPADRARAVRRVRALRRRLSIVTRIPLRTLIEEGRD